MNKNYVAWTIRILVFVLFIVSALAKMFPLWAFEKQLVDLDIASWCQAPYLARLILGVELALGIAILQPNFLKRIVIPATIALLAAFCIHLSIEMVKNGAMNGNCGCFGQLIPMTPLEAFIKNIITIALLVWLYKLTKESEKPHRFSILLLIWSLSTMAVFVAFPFCPCKDEVVDQSNMMIDDTDSTSMDVPEDPTAIAIAMIDTATKSTSQDTVKPKPAGPKQVVSRFASWAVGGGKQFPVDKDKTIVCFFAPGCDHCQQAAKDLTKLSKTPGFPKVFVFFMDEETEKIPEFFTFAGKKFPNRILDAANFWTLFGPTGQTPGVFYLWNGNIQSSYNGIEPANAFTPAKLKADVAKEK